MRAPRPARQRHPWTLDDAAKLFIARNDQDDDIAAIFGCAVITGAGTVFNAARVRPGQNVAVLGLGGVGLNAVMAARIAGATEIIGVDVNEGKFAMARELGCTPTLSPLDPRFVETVKDRTRGGVDFSFDILVTADGDEILMSDATPSATELAVARHVAALIPDRATVQLGIGGLAVAVSLALFGHRDLGVHTGVFSDVFVGMVEKGCVTNAYKGPDAGVSVTGCLFGSRRLNDHASNNPAIAMRSVEYTRRPLGRCANSIANPE